MDVTNRRELSRRALDGYASGPAASTRATARALAKVDNAVVVVLVEGISDQIALETAAVGRGRDLEVVAEPAWRGREPEAQIRRFLGSGSRRELRYARLLVEAAVGRDTLPRPLDALLTAV